MISLILLLIAALLFLLAGTNQDLFDQSPSDFVAFGLLAWVIAVILSGVGPSSPIVRKDRT
jgi:hypothetical protein